MEGSEGSSQECYSTDQQYFLDICRGGQQQQIRQFILTLGQQSKFKWEWTTNSGDNFVHMLAGNNFPQIFNFLIKVVVERGLSQILPKILNHPNSTGNTPLHYAVITNSKQMVEKLLQFDADTSVVNQFGRTAFDEAVQFDKSQIAQILAPVTKQDIQKLKQQFGTLDICNEDSSEEQQQEIKHEYESKEANHQQKIQEKIEEIIIQENKFQKQSQLKIKQKCVQETIAKNIQKTQSA